MADLIKVRTLKPHDNAYGDKPAKAAGDEYCVPEAYLGVLGDLVERADAPAPGAKAKAAPAPPESADAGE